MKLVSKGADFHGKTILFKILLQSATKNILAISCVTINVNGIQCEPMQHDCVEVHMYCVEKEDSF